MIQAKSYGRNHPTWLLSNFLLVRTRAKFWISVAGCLLDNSAPRGPPDVPPRNPTMSRVNGRLPGSHAASDHERDPDLQPSCLVRTSSGGFYSIPSEYPGVLFHGGKDGARKLFNSAPMRKRSSLNNWTARSVLENQKTHNVSSSWILRFSILTLLFTFPKRIDLSNLFHFV